MKLWLSTLWIKSNRWRVIDKLQTKEKEEKRKRMKNVREYLRLRMQKTRSALNVLHKVLCLSQSKQLSFRNFFIISRKFHHFSMRREISMTRAFDDASFRWRELSIARVSVAFFSDVETNEIFVTLFFSLNHQIFWFDFCFNQFDLNLSKYLS